MLQLLQEAAAYAVDHSAEFMEALREHLLLVGVALTVGIIICLPLGILTSRSRAAANTTINVVNGLRVIPSLAILFLAIPYFGLSFTSAAIALTILALPPILLNTDAGFRTVDPAIKESAFGMGMTSRQVLWRVEAPLALPVIVAGVRTAATEVIASATLAAFIGSGGLGLYVVRGFALFDMAILLVGAVPVAGLALLAEITFGRLERRLTPPA
jgi:osmoprotectant transport system permease protein